MICPPQQTYILAIGTYKVLNSTCSHLDYFNNVFNKFSGPASFNFPRSLWTIMQEWSSSQI